MMVPRGRPWAGVTEIVQRSAPRSAVAPYWSLSRSSIASAAAGGEAVTSTGRVETGSSPATSDSGLAAVISAARADPATVCAVRVRVHAALVTSLLLAVPHGWHELRTSRRCRRAATPSPAGRPRSSRCSAGRAGGGPVAARCSSSSRRTSEKPVGPLKRRRSSAFPGRHLSPPRAAAVPPVGRGSSSGSGSGATCSATSLAGPGTTAATRRRPSGCSTACVYRHSLGLLRAEAMKRRNETALRRRLRSCASASRRGARRPVLSARIAEQVVAQRRARNLSQQGSPRSAGRRSPRSRASRRAGAAADRHPAAHPEALDCELRRQVPPTDERRKEGRNAVRTEVEDLQIARTEKLLAVVLAAFLLLGGVWTYTRVDDVVRSHVRVPTERVDSDRAVGARTAPAARLPAQSRSRTALQNLELAARPTAPHSRPRSPQGGSNGSTRRRSCRTRPRSASSASRAVSRRCRACGGGRRALGGAQDRRGAATPGARRVPAGWRSCSPRSGSRTGSSHDSAAGARAGTRSRGRRSGSRRSSPSSSPRTT